jgi:NAD(P)H-quinone oxidoreductase subunit N
MPLLTTGNKFIRDLEESGAVAVYAPLEGGFEGRYQRRLRTKGYVTLHLSAKGLGDPASYFKGVHGVRHPHLGKKNIGQNAEVGDVYFLPPIVDTELEMMPKNKKGLVIWLIEGFVFSRQELSYLAKFHEIEPQVKIVVELGGDRAFRWQKLSSVLAAA